MPCGSWTEGRSWSAFPSLALRISTTNQSEGSQSGRLSGWLNGLSSNTALSRRNSTSAVSRPQLCACGPAPGSQPQPVISRTCRGRQLVLRARRRKEILLNVPSVPTWKKPLAPGKTCCCGKRKTSICASAPLMGSIKIQAFGACAGRLFFTLKFRLRLGAGMITTLSVN